MLFKATSDFLYKSILFFSLIILLVSSWDAPMSGDEYVHVKQAEKNIRYIQSLGKDKEALNTPISRLKHYGQSFDTITTFAAQVFGVENLYRFRHVSNAVVAWLTVLFASLLTIKISRSKVAGFIAVFLFLGTLRFMGHATNNLKDIPFAFAFIFSIYFIIRFLEKMPKISWIDLALITQGLALGISIRIGGLLIFAYFILFTGLFLYYLFVSGTLQNVNLASLGVKVGVLSISVFVLAYFSAILIWPWALENPIKNPWISLDLMHHYPTTVRQIFEGELYWSDRFPWYYLFKYLLFTLPVIVLIGFAFSLYYIWKFDHGKSIIFSLFTLVAVGFPLFYAATTGANVYGGWRQMLFVFPLMVVLAAIGLWKFWMIIYAKKWLRIIGFSLAIVLLIGPVRFFISNYPYQYTFFNQLIVGISGAYGNYELDYYFTSYKKAYNFIDQLVDSPKIVAANFIIPEYYKDKTYKPELIDYYDRSSLDWDYAIICNTFLDPYQLKNGYWPPSDVVYLEEVGGQPILVVVKRRTKLDLQGKKALDRGEYLKAINKLEQALSDDLSNESIRLNLARAYKFSGDFDRAIAVLDYFQKIYPTNEWANEIRGEIDILQGNTDDAIRRFKQNIDHNYKFFHSYINLAKAYNSNGNHEEAIRQLKTCLRINPFYEPAYKMYGRLLIEHGDIELGQKMLDYSIHGSGKYGGK